MAIRTLLSLLACLVTLVPATHGHFQDIFAQTHHEISRTKRQVVMQDNAVCLLTCIETMEEQLDVIKSVRAQKTTAQASTMCQRYEPDQLEALCSSHTEAKNCLAQCPDGEMKTVGMNALTPLNFMCVDRVQDFKKHLPCLDSSCEAVEQACEPVCHNYKNSVDKLTQLQRDKNVRLSYDAAGVTKMVSDACEFINCFNGCSRPLITEKCGGDAADLQRDTVKKAFASITNLLSTVGANDNIFPQSCRALAADGNATVSSNDTKSRTLYAVEDKSTAMKNENGTLSSAVDAQAHGNHSQANRINKVLVSFVVSAVLFWRLLHL